MTRINDYLWHIPHTLEAGDPPEIQSLQQAFNRPIADAVQGPLGEMGYELTSSDIAVRLDERVDNTRDTYYANVRLIRYLQPDIIARIHFEHMEWATFLTDSAVHRYAINLDRFKIADPATQRLIPAWPGRLHTRMSSQPIDVLHHRGEDQIWTFTYPGEFEQQLQLTLEKFANLGRAWLENLTGF